MTIQQRPRPLHQPVDSFADLDAWLERRIADFRIDFDEDEIAQSIGINKQYLSRGRVDAFDQVRFVIRTALAAERSDAERIAAEDGTEAAYREAGYADMPPTIARLMDGDR